jgi:hypothetical protein
MASCTKCGAVLIAQARFCATCGSPVARGASPTSQPPATGVVPSAPDPLANTKKDTQGGPDPFAQTMLGQEVTAEQAALRQGHVSPMAASVMARQSDRPPDPKPAAATPAPYSPRPVSSAPQAPAPYAQPQPQQSHALAPGTLVLVYWADGNRYPGTVLQVAQHHVLVAFPNGMQQWIDARYVTPGA